MTSDRLRAYRFETPEQWKTCLFVQADRDARGAKAGLRPYPPFSRPGVLHGPKGAYAPATHLGEVFWRDECGHIFSMGPTHEDPESFPAPPQVAHAMRMVVEADGVWIVSPRGTLQRFAADTLTHISTVELPDAEIVDVARRGNRGVYALAVRKRAWHAIPIDSGEHAGTCVELGGIAEASQFVWLEHAGRFVVLAGEHARRLHWFSAKGGAPKSSLPDTGQHTCARFDALGSDGEDRVFVAVTDKPDFGGKSFVLAFDGDGLPVGELELDAPATGLTASGADLWVATARGLLQFSAAETVPGDMGEVLAELITPVLHAPDRENQRRWLRIEAEADLPAGTTLQIAHAATDKEERRNRLRAAANEPSKPESLRAKQLLDEPDFWSGTTEFHGSDAPRIGERAPYAAPIHDVRERFLWVRVRVIAAPGAKLPALRRLVVTYPGQTLMEHLPDVYQREESRPGSFLRSLVGVLESTAQDLDARIETLGSRVQPSSASDEWLDFVARWLGLPWDDALTTKQKRDLLGRANDLAKHRGTRTGLELMLESLLQGGARRFRVRDATADTGFAIVGNAARPGSALPALLGGRSHWSSQLGAGSVLGRMRLRCPGQRDDPAGPWAGRIRIDVAASARERAEWEPWLLALITDMVPLTVRVELRWVTARALQPQQLGDELTLEAEPSALLGTEAVTGAVRLPSRPSTLSATGPIGDIRLL